MEDNNKNIATDSDLMRQLLEESKKEVRFSRILAFTFLGILAVLIVTVAMLLPRAISTLEKVDAMVDDAQTIMVRATRSLDEVSSMTESITKTSDVAFESLGKVNFEELNMAITDLRDAIEPMANFARLFQR